MPMELLARIKKSLCFGHIILLIIYMISITFIYFTPITHDDYNLRLVYGENITTPPQLYYDTGESFKEEQSIFATCHGKTADFILDDSIRKNTISYRIDPIGGTVLDLRLRSLSIVLEGKEIQTFSEKDLEELFAETNHIDNVETRDGDVILAIIDSDPWFIIDKKIMDSIPEYIQQYGNSISRLRILYASILALSACTLICLRNWIFFHAKKVCRTIGNKMQGERLSKITDYWLSPAARLPKFRKIAYVASATIFFATTILYSIGYFLTHYFSNLTMQEIVFHLKVPMTGTGSSMLVQYFQSARMPLIVSGIALTAVIILLAKQKKIRNCRLATAITSTVSLLLCFLTCADLAAKVDLPGYIANQTHPSAFIEKNYVVPNKASISFPEKKRNLIYIYLESMESTFISKKDGGCMEEDLIPELTQLAQENINFSDSAQVGGGTSSTGSEWTVAAMAAMSCGLPLLIPIDGNSYGEYASFLPGAISLGDILKANGYAQEIMVGSDLTFGGRRNFFTQHGDYKVYDLYTARNRDDLPDDYDNDFWGVEDAKLFSYAKEEITKLAEGTKPFNFTMLTVDTHHVGGFLCELCKNEHETQYENVLSCSSRQTAAFVKWLKSQDFYKDTTIIITGDHPSMDYQYIESSYDGSKPRKVYNCFINAIGNDSNSKNRNFSTFDMFPTTLAAMGCKISGDRLGLGTNLFSGKKTLAETCGYDKIEGELAKRSPFYEKQILEAMPMRWK